MSRHSPIWIELNLGTLPTKKLVAAKTPVKPSWPKATIEDIKSYTSRLGGKLEALHSPGSLVCSEPHCADVTHSEERDSYMLDILLSIVETTHTSLPLSGGRRVNNGKAGSRAIPG